MNYLEYISNLNTIKLSACIHAERLYNTYQREVLIPLYTPEQDNALERIIDQYNDILKECVAYGIGGVLINGTFRDLTDVLNEVNT